MSICVTFLPIFAYFQNYSEPFWLSPNFEKNRQVAKRRQYRSVPTHREHIGSNKGIAQPKIRGQTCLKNAISLNVI